MCFGLKSNISYKKYSSVVLNDSFHTKYIKNSISNQSCLSKIIKNKDNMDKSEYSKTPISTLQEYCQKLGKTPQYDLICSEGRAHQPQFVYTCKVGEFTSEGKGGSKKQAKHEAAQKVLQALTQQLAPHDKALQTRLQVTNILLVVV